MQNALATDERLLVAVSSGQLPVGRLTEVTGLMIIFARTLVSVPADPARHLTVAHAEARPYLLRLLQHDPSHEVMANRGRFTYTPRKVLRRVLDHALDHLNQIDQWVAWQEQGLVPIPTDGWAGSSATLDEDRFPLSEGDLNGWMWRIDQAARLVVQRAEGLSARQLDWLPPDGGWSLRRVLHHLAAAEWLYATALEDLLPGDPASRYREAARRFRDQVDASANDPGQSGTVYVHPSGELYTRARAIQEALDAEGELLRAAHTSPHGRTPVSL